MAGRRLVVRSMRVHGGLAWTKAMAVLVAVALVASTGVVGPLAGQAAAASSFTPGDLVVYRVGDGSAGLTSSGNAVFLDEYSPSGALVQSIPLPTADSGADHALIASGTATSEGLLSRSADGRYVLLTGYDRAVGGTGSLASTTATAVPRTVARIGSDGTVDTSTALTDFATGNNPRSATSADGTSVWVAGGAGGVRYAPIGATTSADLSSATFANVRQVAAVDGQLYASSGSGTNTFRGVETVGAGLPTTDAQTVTRLGGLTDTTNPSSYGFFFADLSSAVAGNDTLYVADDGTGALAKFSLVGGVWTPSGVVGADSDDYRGLTGVVQGGAVTLYATRMGGSGSTGGGQLVSVTDGSGYNGAFAATPTVLATAGANTAFRGVALAPAGSAADPRPDLRIGLTAPSTVATGHPLTYTITATNAGASAAEGVVVTLALPAGVTETGLTGSGGFTGSSSGATVTFSGGTLAAGASATLLVNVTAPEGTVTLPAGAASIDPANAIVESNEANNSSANAVTTVVTSESTTRIHDIQGAAQLSPLTGQSVQGVPGIVTGLESNGFYLQDPNPDSDPATSEAVFVFTSSSPKVAVGDAVLVAGTVQEFRPGGATGTNNLTTTEIAGPTITPVSSANALPAPVVIGAGGRVPPSAVIEANPTGNAETHAPFDPATNGIDFYESLEAMRVQLNDAAVVGPTARFGTASSSNAEIYTVGDMAAAAGPRSARGGLLLQANDANPERVIIEGPNSALPDAKVGDAFPGPTVGVVSYDFGNFKLRPTQPLPPLRPGYLPKESTALTNGSGRLTVTTFNVENLNPGDPQTKFDQLGSAIVTNLGAPAILSVEEIQDNDGPTDDGVVNAGTTVSKLLASITAAGGPAYQSRLIDPVNDQDGGQPGGNIRQAFLFRPDLVSFVDIAGGGSTSATTVVAGPNGPDLSASPGRIDPTNAAFAASRKPLVGEFSFGGQKVFVIANHIIAKVGDDELFGKDQPPVEVTKAERLQQTAVLKSFSQSLLAVDPAAKLIVLGDLNDNEFSDPLATLDSTPLVDLVTTLPAAERYTYDFEGNSEVLDHILASTSLAPAAQTDVVHLNAEYPDSQRLSDHDPVVAAFDLNAHATAAPDNYAAASGFPLSVDGAHGVLANDSGTPRTIVGHSAPAHGSVSLAADGSFTYTPEAGFSGRDTFSYTISDAVQKWTTDLPPLAVIGGVDITAGAYGSSFTPVPGSTDEYYGLTDRGPNVAAPDGSAIEPLPAFDPAIGKLKLVGQTAVLEQSIPLRAADGTPYTGRVNPTNPTGETIEDLNGHALAPDLNGYDSEGLVALPDGTFWVSDEYGPFVTHFDATGKAIERLSPFDGSLPDELAARVPNRGLEGLTVTPDGTTLVAMMQSSLQQPDLNGSDAKKLTPVRIVTYNLVTHAEHEYLYLLDDPASNKTAVSEIAAVTDTTFVVDERDGNFPPATYKKMWLIDLSGATDIGSGSTVPGATYDPAHGLLIGGSTIEKLLLGDGTAASASVLAAHGIAPVGKQLDLDLGGLLTTLDSQGRFFSHDKVEGVSVLDGGATLVLSNDSDFGIDGVTGTTTPFQLHAKVSPATGVQDDGEVLAVNLARLPAPPSTATVTVDVRQASMVSIVGGSHQTAVVGRRFSTPLTAKVTDSRGLPVPGAVVTFSAPTTPKTASLQPTTVATDASGLASTVATAGAVGGSYVVTAAVAGVTAPAKFDLTNAPSADVSVSLEAPGKAGRGTRFDYTLTIADNGPGDTGQVNALLTLPPGVRVIAAPGTDLRLGNLLFYTSGPLHAGGVRTVHVTVEVSAPRGTALFALAAVSSGVPDPTLANNAATVRTNVS